eukprot:NODE_1961_length_1736_cov_32.152511_g1670_i0.p1 GENE.NODE_1961_length_1736_cov_32.152511_g1670_i0~~NODE_1961_length_1736_cov_32.152511_g1670_i0.p1  ORF type:complete len:357 (+),score=27.17 NODE_1961_length_1736_cov_32.152511_g1670_i0:242-1312(+)
MDMWNNPQHLGKVMETLWWHIHCIYQEYLNLHKLIDNHVLPDVNASSTVATQTASRKERKTAKACFQLKEKLINNLNIPNSNPSTCKMKCREDLMTAGKIMDKTPKKDKTVKKIMNYQILEYQLHNAEIVPCFIDNHKHKRRRRSRHKKFSKSILDRPEHSSDVVDQDVNLGLELIHKNMDLGNESNLNLPSKTSELFTTIPVLDSVTDLDLDRFNKLQDTEFNLLHNNLEIEKENFSKLSDLDPRDHYSDEANLETHLHEQFNNLDCENRMNDKTGIIGAAISSGQDLFIQGNTNLIMPTYVKAILLHINNHPAVQVLIIPLMNMQFKSITNSISYPLTSLWLLLAASLQWTWTP